MYALVEIKGKQYRVEKDALLKVDRFCEEPGAPVVFDSVLCTVEGDTVKIGKPYVSGVTVKATVESHEKGGKVRVYKYKRRKSYRRTRGHRQQYTMLRIGEISGI
jgi:large subunit ribosomal protein L21